MGTRCETHCGLDGGGRGGEEKEMKGMKQRDELKQDSHHFFFSHIFPELNKG